MSSRSLGPRAGLARGTRALELLSSYLPLVLMAVLALGTWWLVNNAPVSQTPAATGPLRHEPDYQMSHFTVRRFGADGAMRAQIDGDTMRHYPDTDTLEIDNVRIRAIAADTRVTLADARSAVSNGDGSEVQLRGGAHVVRQGLGAQEPMEFRGEFLQAFLDTEQVRSHLPVTLTRGRTVIRAQAMAYDNVSSLLELKGPVDAVFVPPATAAGASR